MRLNPLIRVGAGALLVLAALFGLWRLANARCFQLVGEVTCRIDTDERLVALTFDDGPTQKGVEAVLPSLERYEIEATFFLVGESVASDPAAARQLHDAGHELGNHTYTHRRMLARWPSTYADEIERTNALLRAAGEAKPSLLRPPYAKRLIGFPMAASNADYRMITWDVEEPGMVDDPHAYADEILRNVRPGSIVLMHPMYGNQDVVRDALPLIIERLRQRGYRMVTVSELLKAEAP